MDLINFITNAPSISKWLFFIGLIMILAAFIVAVSAQDKINKNNAQSSQIKIEMNKSETNTNSGVNLGNIGGSGNTVNQYNTFKEYTIGQQIRHIPSELFSQFEIKFPDKNIQIRFCSMGSVSGDMIKVKDTIIRELNTRGYVNVNKQYNMIIGVDMENDLMFGENKMGGATFFIKPV